MIDNVTSNINSFYQSRYWHQCNANFTHSPDRQNHMTTKQKAVVLASAAAGMTPVLAFLAHKKGFSLNPVKIFKTPIKDWALFKYSPLEKSIEFKPAPIIATATSSVAGGFIGGALVDDKSNLRAKKREVLSQLLGDVIVPIGCVWLGSIAYNKVADKLVKAMPKIAKDTKFANVFNKISENLPNALATVLSLGVGIIAGNKVSNEINEKLYHKPVQRGIKATDFAPHVDDLCMATSMMNQGSLFASKIARVIPLALLVPGYETGTAQEN